MSGAVLQKFTRKELPAIPSHLELILEQRTDRASIHINSSAIIEGVLANTKSLM